MKFIIPPNQNLGHALGNIINILDVKKHIFTNKLTQVCIHIIFNNIQLLIHIIFNNVQLLIHINLNKHIEKHCNLLIWIFWD